jgi:SAM-dependent methyltransferase
VVSTVRTSHAIRVDPTNADALRAWDGSDGDFWAEEEHVFDHSLHHYRQAFLDAADVRPGDHVLDVGCGNGETTRDAAALAPHGRALGVDLSTRMLDQARRRAAEAGLTNADFLQADAQVHPFAPASFDLAISRTGTMFFGDAVAAFANIRRALRPGGRLALLVWQGIDRNEWIRELRTSLAAGRDLPDPPPGAPGPFCFADPAHGRSVLTAAGWDDVVFTGVEEPMWFGPSAEDAFGFLSRQGPARFLLRDLDPESRERALASLRASADAHVADEGVVYPSAVWIVTARRP